MRIKKVKYLFLVLVYRNTKDLQEFIKSVDDFNLNSQIIVINSHYDDESMKEIARIAEKNNCCFLNIENKGYGFGNNRGIEYANKNFQYEFLIVSNPDILIKKFDENSLLVHKKNVVGPLIKTLSNKNQNPYWVINNFISEWLVYKGHEIKSKSILYLGIAVNKIIREVFLLFFNLKKIKYSRVFALHGSFVIFSYEVIKKIGLPYDEEIFLFTEEAHIAHLLKRNKIESFIIKDIQVFHKEDGSMKIAKIDEMNEMRKSVMTYYEKNRIKNRF